MSINLNPTINMTDNKVELSLLTSNKSGILSSLMMQGSKLGLMYHQHHLEKVDDDRSRMSIIFEGSLNCSESEFLSSIESHSEIHTIEKVSIGKSVTAETNPSSSKPEFATLRAHYVITPESLKVAEEHLINSLGVAAPLVVEYAAQKTKHIGDLFLLLSEELEGDARRDFLSLVSDLDLNQIK